VHSELECLGIVHREDALPTVASTLRPLGASEAWIEVFFDYFRGSFIENFCALL
jgi:hypothetical protein